MSHTPGPWKADVDGPFTLGGDTIAVNAVTKDGRYVRREICTTMIDTSENDDTPEAEEDKANARLIAAAPDLLTVCRQLQQYFDTEGPHDFDAVRAIAADAVRVLVAVEATKSALPQPIQDGESR